MRTNIMGGAEVWRQVAKMKSSSSSTSKRKTIVPQRNNLSGKKVLNTQSKRYYRSNFNWKNGVNNILTDCNSGTEKRERILSPLEEKESTHGLLKYFTELSQTESDDVDFDKIEQLHALGAAVNAVVESTGQSVFHDIASNWDTDVANFMLEKGTDIHSKDNNGRTPLHVAADSDHKEMVVWLLEHGAEIEERTHSEKQTPVYYATRSGSLQALQTLIEWGANYETRDYKGRTPLHLATELGRIPIAKYLLSLDVPAECCVVDNLGNHVLTSMIRTMPIVTFAALDQLQHVTGKTKFILLSGLEPKPGVDITDGTKTPFEMAVETGHYDILYHPVMQELTKQKWSKFAKWMLYFDISIYLIFLLSWSVLIAYPSLLEKDQYTFPRDIWRIVLQLIAISTYLQQIVEEVVEVVKSSKSTKQHKKLRFQALMDDLKNTSSSQLEERKYLENELIKINKSPPSYFKDPWNVIDIITYITLGVLIVLHAVDIGVHRVQLALWTARMSCVGIVLIWIRLLKYARGFRFIGPLISTVGHLIDNLYRYFIIYTIVFCPYVICFWVLFGGVQSEGVEDREDLTGFHRVAIMVFRISLVDEYPFPTYRNVDELMGSLLILTFFLITAIVGVNLTGKKWPFAVAAINTTFHQVYDTTHAMSFLHQALTIQSYEEKLCWCIYQRYLVYIHNNCNPIVRVCGTAGEKCSITKLRNHKKKIVQIYNIVAELQAAWERRESEEESRMAEMSHTLETLAKRIEQQEDKIASMGEDIAKIKVAIAHTK